MLTEVIPLALVDVAEAGLLPLIPLGFDTGNGFSKLAVGFGAIFGIVPAIWCVEMGDFVGCTDEAATAAAFAAVKVL